jgi:ribonuclease HI
MPPCGQPLATAILLEGGNGTEVYGQSNGRRLSLHLGQYATVFQAEVFAILACAHDIAVHGLPGKHLSICSDSQAALKALRAIRMCPLVRQCQEALEDISTRHTVRLYWVPGHAEVRGNETANGLVRNGSASDFVGPEPALGISRQDLHLELIAGWGTSTRDDGGISGTPNDRLGS